MKPKRRKFDGLVGKAFHHLTVVERRPTRGEWLCRCECGKTVIARGPDLVSGRYRSCGCQFASFISLKNTQPNNLAIKKVLYRQCKNSADARGHEFTLTLEQFIALIIQPCQYCGIQPTKTANLLYWWRKGVTLGDFVCNGIDRVDNERGYLPENCVPCCEMCNKSKHILPLEFWLQWVRRLAQHQGIAI